MKNMFLAMVVLSLFGSVQAQASDTIMSVGACVNGKTVKTRWMGDSSVSSVEVPSGSYTVSKLLVVKCAYSSMRGGVQTKTKKAKYITFDLAWYEDNDRSGITEQLRNDCELERERLLKLVVANEDCQ